MSGGVDLQPILLGKWYLTARFASLRVESAVLGLVVKCLLMLMTRGDQLVTRVSSR